MNKHKHKWQFMEKRKCVVLKKTPFEQFVFKNKEYFEARFICECGKVKSVRIMELEGGAKK